MITISLLYNFRLKYKTTIRTYSTFYSKTVFLGYTTEILDVQRRVRTPHKRYYSKKTPAPKKRPRIEQIRAKRLKLDSDTT